MEDRSKEDIMVHYLEVVLKRDFVSGWKYMFENGWKSALEKLRVFFDKASKWASEDSADGVDCNEKTEEMGWQEKFGRKWYY